MDDRDQKHAPPTLDGPATVDSGPAPRGPETVDSGPADPGPQTVDSGPQTVDSGPGTSDSNQPAVPSAATRRVSVRSRVPLDAGPLPASLASRFKDVRELGRGGMGLVCAATDVQLGREVAIKVVLKPDPRHLQMFQDEARILASLEHEHVVRVYEYGLADGLPFLIMELVRGNALSANMAQGRKLVVDAVRIAAGIAAGVAAAHQRGIVHLDLKPGNVFLDELGRAKVADFGLAQLVRQDGAAPGFRGGTPGYMPPEQFEGRAGLPADVYAFGVMLHELLAGARLFRMASNDIHLLLSRQRSEPVPPPSRANPSVPGVLDDLVARCLASDADARPSIEKVRKTLDDWLEDLRRMRGKPSAAGFPAQPYKLLSSYGPGDDAIFFGRESETSELVQLVEHPDVRLVQVFGACGSGKSSLLRAGLAGPLSRAGWETAVVIAGAEPARVIRQALASIGARAGVPEAELAALAEPSSRIGAEPFARAVARVCAKLGKKLALIVDQSEEVFTLNPRGAPAIEDAFETLVRLAEIPALPLKVLLAYRIEFRGDWMPLEQRLARLQHTFAVREMNEQGLVDAIEGPARIEHYGYSFEKGLSERLAHEIAAVSRERGDASLPTLQIICHQLHESMDGRSRRIDTALYETTLGGAQGALQRFVEQRLESPAYRRTGSMARQILQALTRKDEGGERYAQVALEDELLDFPDRAEARRTLESLLTDHLVVRAEDAEGRKTVRLASEVICPLIDAWTVEPDAAQRAARLLARCHRRWAEEGRRPGLLLGGPDLDLVASQQANLRALPAGELEYIALSRTRDRQQRMVRGAVACVIALISSLLYYVVYLRPGTVQLDSDPEGAVAMVDGRAVGETPFKWEGRPGVHTVSLVKPDHAVVEAAVVVSVGGNTITTHALPYLKGTLQLVTDPPGALAELVRLHDQPPGPPLPPEAPLRAQVRSPVVTEIYRGDYAMHVEAPGFEPVDLPRLTIKGNRMPTVKNLVLKRITGSLAVTCTQVGAKLRMVDPATGEVAARGTVPLGAPLVVAAGRYRVETGQQYGLIDFRSVEISKDTTAAIEPWCPDLRAMWQQRVGRPWGPVGVADLDRDGAPDLVVGGLDGVLHALSGCTGAHLWRREVGAPVACTPALADLDGDGVPDAVVGAHDGTVLAVSGRTGEVLWRAKAGGKLQSSPAAGDLDGDGTPDVVLGCYDRSVYAFNGRTGAKLWSAATGGEVHADPRVVDLDGDGRPDVVIGSEDGAVHALGGKTGKPLWTRPAGGKVNAGTIPLAAKGGVLLAAISGDGSLLILEGATGAVRARVADQDGAYSEPLDLGDIDGDGVEDVAACSRSHRVVRAISGASGRVLWRFVAAEPLQGAGGLASGLGLVVNGADAMVCLDPRTGAPLWGFAPRHGLANPLTFADLDGDGVAELVQPTGEDVVVFARRVAEARWVHDAAQKVQSRPEVADLDGDGQPEIIFGSNDFSIRALDGRDGRPKWRYRTGARATAWPAVGDLNGDGQPDVVAGCEDGRVSAISGRTGKPLWGVTLEAHVVADPLVVQVDGRPVAVAAALDGRVSALDGKTGKKRWDAAAGGEVHAGLAAVALPGEKVPRVLVAAYDGTLRALDASTGREIWKYRTAGRLTTNVALADLDGDGTPEVLVGGDGGRVHAVSARDGAALWRAFVDGKESFYENPFGFADANGDGRPDVVLVRDGAVTALDGRDGRTLWQDPASGITAAAVVIPAKPGALDLVTTLGRFVVRRSLEPRPRKSASAAAIQAMPPVGGGMATDGTLAAVSGTDSVLQAIALGDGKLAWSTPLESRLTAPAAVLPAAGGSPALAAFGTADAQLRLVELATGKPARTIPTNGAVWSRPAVADLDGDGRADLVVVTAKGEVSAISGATGSILWTRAMGAGVPVACAAGRSDVATHTIVVIPDEAGRLHALDGRTGEVRWEARMSGRVSALPCIAKLRGHDAPSVLVGTEDGGVQAFALATGAPGPSLKLPMAATGELGVTDGGDVVAGERSGAVHAFDGASFQPRWHLALEKSLAAVAADRSGLVLITFGGEIRRLGPSGP